MCNMCSDVTERFHRNHLNNLNFFKETVQCCGGNDSNIVRQLYFVKSNIDSGLTLNTIMYLNILLVLNSGTFIVTR